MLALRGFVLLPTALLRLAPRQGAVAPERTTLNPYDYENLELKLHAQKAETELPSNNVFLIPNLKHDHSAIYLLTSTKL